MKPVTFWKILAIISWLITAIVIYLWLFIPDLEAGQEPNWNKLVPIIIQIESGGNPNAVSEDDCIGLMQISPMVLEEYNQKHPSENKIVVARGQVRRVGKNGLEIKDWSMWPYIRDIDLYDEDVNKTIGTWYLKRIWFHYLKGKGTINDMLICYNFGYGNFKKWVKQGGDYSKLPKETRNYIAAYKKLAGGKR